MKPTKKKKLSCYIKLFKMFESELKNYDSIFSNGNYILNYIVCRDYFGGEDEINVIFKIFPSNSETTISGEKFRLKSVLRNYCKYFSVKDVTVIKSLRAEKAGKILATKELTIPNIEDRVYFEYFRLIDKYVAISG